MERAFRRGFTLIELLVVIAVIAIVSVVVILVLNPAQLLMQSRDANRLSDAATLKSALGIYSEDIGGSMGSSSVVYISIPDPLATSSAGDQCQGLSLPSAASDTYQCASSSTFRKIDGTGWIPLNFKSLSFGAPISNLPIDPLNVSSTGQYYTYITNGTQYETTMALESSKNALTEASDAGQYSDLYEQGTNLALAPIDFFAQSGFTPSTVGLVGYWNMEEGSGGTGVDQSGNGNNTTWGGTQAGTSGYYSGGKVGTWAGTFNGGDDVLTRGSFTNQPTGNGARSISAWIKPSNCTGGPFVITMFGVDSGSPLGYGVYLTGACKVKSEFDSSAGALTSAASVVVSTWSYVVATYTGSVSSIYINGSLNASTSYSSANTSGGTINIGQWSNGTSRFQGLIDDVRIYNRAMSASEIQSMYNLQK